MHETWHMENGVLADAWTWDVLPHYPEEKLSRSKTEWGPGPWLEEPDKMSWTDPGTGLPCLIVRGPLGALCGYVGVDETHEWHGQEYHRVPVDVHGGLTFADACDPGENQETGICHIPKPGASDHVWWFGFDCAHYMDYVPAMAESMKKYSQDFDPPEMYTRTETYKAISYVMAQCTQLARQLWEPIRPELELPYWAMGELETPQHPENRGDSTQNSGLT